MHNHGNTQRTVEGYVQVAESRRGDVNCDGDRDAVDVLFTLQEDVALRDGIEDCSSPVRSRFVMNEAQGDVNGDNVTNAVDAMLTMQCVVGTENMTCPGEDNVVQRTTEGEDQGSGTLSIAYLPAGTSGTVQVPLMLKDAAHMGAGSAEISYNNELMTITDCTMDPDGAFDNGACNMEFGADALRLNFISILGFNQDAQIAELTFELRQPLAENYHFEIVTDAASTSDGTALELRSVTDQDALSADSVDNADDADNGSSLLETLI